MLLGFVYAWSVLFMLGRSPVSCVECCLKVIGLSSIVRVRVYRQYGSWQVYIQKQDDVFFNEI